MRVAITLEQCWHAVPGGTAVAALGTARSLAARDDVEVVGLSARHRSDPPEAFRPPIAVRSLPLPRRALYEAWHRLRWPPVQRATGEVSIVHATSLAVPPRRGAPLVVTIHDLAPRHHPRFFTKRGVSFFERGLAIARAEADLVLVPSEATRRDCADAGFSDARLRLVPHGIDRVAVDREEIDRFRSSANLERPYVLWTGTIEPRKNLSALVAAWRRLDADVDLVLAGPRGWEEDLDALLGAKRDRVHVFGFLPRRELTLLYAGAEVFCFPSIMEGFGFPVLEAMAQGTPVVTSRGTSTEEIAGAAALLIDPKDPDDIARALDIALHDEPLRAKLAQAGPARASEYSWERHGELTVAAYKEVAWQR